MQGVVVPCLVLVLHRLIFLHCSLTMVQIKISEAGVYIVSQQNYMVIYRIRQIHTSMQIELHAESV